MRIDCQALGNAACMLRQVPLLQRLSPSSSSSSSSAAAAAAAAASNDGRATTSKRPSGAKRGSEASLIDGMATTPLTGTLGNPQAPLTGSSGRTAAVFVCVSAALVSAEDYARYRDVGYDALAERGKCLLCCVAFSRFACITVAFAYAAQHASWARCASSSIPQHSSKFAQCCARRWPRLGRTPWASNGNGSIVSDDMSRRSIHSFIHSLIHSLSIEMIMQMYRRQLAAFGVYCALTSRC